MTAVLASDVGTWTHFSVYNASDVCLHVVPLNTPRSGLLTGDSIVFKASGADKISISIP